MRITDQTFLERRRSQINIGTLDRNRDLKTRVLVGEEEENKMKRWDKAKK